MSARNLLVGMVICVALGAVYLQCMGGTAYLEGGPPPAQAPAAAPIPDERPGLGPPGFRVAGVHYWQGNWNYNFWSNLEEARLDADFEAIRALHFNTVLVSVPWGVFQPEAFPPRYSDEAFAKLERFVAKAGEHGLNVVLRVATPEHIPAGIDGGNYRVPYLFFDDRELGAYCDLFRETSRRLEGFDNLLFLFSSWEDMYGYATASRQGLDARLVYLQKAGSYAAHLRSRPLDDWNARWRTSYSSFDDVPFPVFGSLAYRDFLEWADDRLLDVILPAIARATKDGSDRVRISHEIRVDSDPVWSDGPDQEPEWIHHYRTWNLTPEHDVITAYFNPYWMAPNQGDFISAEAATRNLKTLLRLLEVHTEGRPIFFDQFNFTDSTPAFARNSRLAGEDEIARFIELGLDELYEHSAGYALWAFRAYEANVIYNSTFEGHLTSWTALPAGSGGAPSSHFDEERQERYVSLPPGAAVVQTVDAPWNPGSADPETPFALRFSARSNAGGEATVRIEVPDGEGWTVLHEQAALPQGEGWSELTTSFDYVQRLRISLLSTGTGPVDVDDVTLFNHVQDAAVLGPRGETLGRRAEVLGGINAEWPDRIHRVSARFGSALDAEALRRLTSVHPDGWIEQEARLPLTFPWYRGTLRLDAHFPLALGEAGNAIEVWLDDRSLGTHRIDPGEATVIRIPLEGHVKARGDRWLTVRTAKTFRASDADPASYDERELGVVLLRAEVEPPAPDDAERKILEVDAPGATVEIVVNVVGPDGRPRADVRVSAHRTDGHAQERPSDSAGRVIFRLDPESTGPGSDRVFVELLGGDARLQSVRQR